MFIAFKTRQQEDLIKQRGRMGGGGGRFIASKTIQEDDLIKQRGRMGGGGGGGLLLPKQYRKMT